MAGGTTKIFQIVDYFIAKNLQSEYGLSNKKLQKLLYYSQGWYLAFSDGQKLFENKIEAWVHGPAISTVYHEFKNNGSNNITKEINLKELKNKLTKLEIKTLDMVWENYGKFEANFLEEMTHNEPAWIEARAGIPEYKSSKKTLKIATMYKFFSDFYYGKEK